jgi:hypothetical protein
MNTGSDTPCQSAFLPLWRRFLDAACVSERALLEAALPS